MKKKRYVAISTNNQTGNVLGTVRKLCSTLSEAWGEAGELNSDRGSGVVRRVIGKKRVKVGETVGFFDDRLTLATGRDEKGR